MWYVRVTTLDVNNTNIESVVMETKQWVTFALSEYKIFLNRLKTMKVIRSIV